MQGRRTLALALAMALSREQCVLLCVWPAVPDRAAVTQAASRPPPRRRHAGARRVSRAGLVHRPSAALRAYALAVVGNPLFVADLEADAQGIPEALSAPLAAFNFTVLPLGELLLRLPLPAARRFQRGRERLDATIYEMI